MTQHQCFCRKPVVHVCLCKSRTLSREVGDPPKGRNTFFYGLSGIAICGSLALIPHYIFHPLSTGLRQHTAEVEALLEIPPIHNPDKIPVKRFARFALHISHRRVLNLDDNACRGLDVGTMNLSVWSRVRHFSRFLGEPGLPFAVPIRLVFPPRIAVPSRCMGPMMYDAGPALCHHRTIAIGTGSPHTSLRFGSLPVHMSVLHDRLSGERYRHSAAFQPDPRKRGSELACVAFSQGPASWSTRDFC